MERRTQVVVEEDTDADADADADADENENEDEGQRGPPKIRAGEVFHAHGGKAKGPMVQYTLGDKEESPYTRLE